MAWNAVGTERFRSYREYREMSENLTAVQERCTELLLEARDIRQKLVEKDALIQKLKAAMVLSGGQPITIPPPTLDVAAVSGVLMAKEPPFLEDQQQPEADGLPMPSQRTGAAPRSRRLTG